MALAQKNRMAGVKPSALSAPSGRASMGRTYVVLGDGEINAGVIWEGAMAAAKFRLGNLTAILDYNGIQQTGATADVMPTEPIADKWPAFGWHVQEIDGHNMAQVLDAPGSGRRGPCPPQHHHCPHHQGQGRQLHGI